MIRVDACHAMEVPLIAEQRFTAACSLQERAAPAPIRAAECWHATHPECMWTTSAEQWLPAWQRQAQVGPIAGSLVQLVG